MTKFEQGNYVIARTDGKKTVLFRIDNISKGILSGTLTKDMHITKRRKNVEVPASSVIALLTGDEIFAGRAFGQDTSLIYRGKKTHKDFGPLHMFYMPEQNVRDALMAGFDKSYSILKKHGLEFLVDPSTSVWEVYPYNGEKFAGSYRNSRDPGNNPYRFMIRPECWEYKDYPYVVLHELTHHMHAHYATGTKLNGEWLRLFTTSIKVDPISRSQCETLLTNLLAQSDVPSGFKGQLEESEQTALKWILKAIQREHRLSIKELDTLFEAECYDDIRSVWPMRGVSSNDLAPVVSEYACKHVKELIAEAVSFHLVGKKIPKAVVKLVEKTISYAKSNREK